MEKKRVIPLYTVCFICNEKVKKERIFCCVNTVNNTIKEIRSRTPVICVKCIKIK